MLIQSFTDNGVQFPEFWDEAKVTEAFKTMDTVELMRFFKCNNATSFSKLLKPCFPNKPDRSSYSAYAKDLIAQQPRKSMIRFGKPLQDQEYG